ncbi:MAG: crosslink repair DNA glycosylase YcaQ family protein [Lautropia sp.]|nr:crosslink repair DNA glycosylase YcaQ family protein [Lautropia sp.]
MNITQLRRLALASQGLSSQQPFGKGERGALRAIEHLGYVQIDTLAVIERAHHHVLWTRVPGYRPEHLQRLVKQREVFEHWFHAAAYLPMRDYRFALPRMHAIRREGHMWFKDVDERLMREILARVRADGPLRLRALHGAGSGSMKSEGPVSAAQGAPGTGDPGWWTWGPVRKALDKLFMQGDLMISAREGMEKIYDLTERVLPPGVDTRTPSHEEYAAWLLDTHLRAHGVVNSRQVLHLRTDGALRTALRDIIHERIGAGQLRALDKIGLPGAYATPEQIARLLKAPPKTVRLLSPFDNLVIHRERLHQLFGFDYRLECYLPASKRVYGYFCLPILYGEQFVGRVDCKAHRAEKRFQILRLHLDTTAIDRHSFEIQLADALLRLANFNGCDQLDMIRE